MKTLRRLALFLLFLTSQRVDSLYIRHGNLRLGPIVALVAFVVMIAGVIPITELVSRGKDLNWARILPWTPWVLIMVLSNAADEELILCGLFIGKMEPFPGRFATNIVTTIPFGLLHAYTGYSADQTIFLALQLLSLSLAWCWLMQKTNSIWAPSCSMPRWIFPSLLGFFPPCKS